MHLKSFDILKNLVVNERTATSYPGKVSEEASNKMKIHGKLGKNEYKSQENQFRRTCDRSVTNLILT